MKYLDTLTNKVEELLETETASISSSFRITQSKLTKEECKKIGIHINVDKEDKSKRKYYGINCANWFTQAEFDKRFKKIF